QPLPPSSRASASRAAPSAKAGCAPGLEPATTQILFIPNISSLSLRLSWPDKISPPEYRESFGAGTVSKGRSPPRLLFPGENRRLTSSTRDERVRALLR